MKCSWGCIQSRQAGARGPCSPCMPDAGRVQRWAEWAQGHRPPLLPSSLQWPVAGAQTLGSQGQPEIASLEVSLLSLLGGDLWALSLTHRPMLAGQEGDNIYYFVLTKHRRGAGHIFGEQGLGVFEMGCWARGKRLYNVIVLIYLSVTARLSPKELNVRPAKHPSRWGNKAAMSRRARLIRTHMGSRGTRRQEAPVEVAEGRRGPRVDGAAATALCD